MDEESIKPFDPFPLSVPEDGVEKFTPFCVPEGISGLWLKKHVSSADRPMQVSLGKLIEAMLAEGIRQGKTEAIKALEQTPTISAAIASLEADIIKLNREFNDEHRGK